MDTDGYATRTRVPAVEEQPFTPPDKQRNKMSSSHKKGNLNEKEKRQREVMEQTLEHANMDIGLESAKQSTIMNEDTDGGQEELLNAFTEPSTREERPNMAPEDSDSDSSDSDSDSDSDEEMDVDSFADMKKQFRKKKTDATDVYRSKMNVRKVSKDVNERINSVEQTERKKAQRSSNKENAKPIKRRTQPKGIEKVSSKPQKTVEPKETVAKVRTARRQQHVSGIRRCRKAQKTTGKRPFAMVPMYRLVRSILPKNKSITGYGMKMLHSFIQNAAADVAARVSELVHARGGMLTSAKDIYDAVSSMFGRDGNYSCQEFLRTNETVAEEITDSHRKHIKSFFGSQASWKNAINPKKK